MYYSLLLTYMSFVKVLAMILMKGRVILIAPQDMEVST